MEYAALHVLHSLRWAYTKLTICLISFFDGKMLAPLCGTGEVSRFPPETPEICCFCWSQMLRNKFKFSSVGTAMYIGWKFIQPHDDDYVVKELQRQMQVELSDIVTGSVADREVITLNDGTDKLWYVFVNVWHRLMPYIPEKRSVY